jgi:hypothetical protein
MEKQNRVLHGDEVLSTLGLKTTNAFLLLFYAVILDVAQSNTTVLALFL